ncbi:MULTISPECIES: DinB family protein [unclassified Mycolicibacterium]|uniref:DinB family protein n=1 Tax=unclassified Mycolicibacterium TaxID=2636767 RepID=UPI002EDB1D34
MTEPIEPDSKDWTWVLNRPCPECGFDSSQVPPAEVAARIRDDAAAWVPRLQGPGVATRSRADRWSTLEYGCHVRDVHRIFAHRVELMLTEDDPQFPNWDQDATAVADGYASQDPSRVSGELSEAAGVVADVYDRVPDGSWQRRGLRSNGSTFTVSTIALYHLHDIVHHAHDVSH